MKIINISSGKGGTGKTLITAVLAELLSRKNNLRVLLVDMDVFVRGLTCLLYYQSDRRVRLVDENRATVSDIISSDAIFNEIGITRYRTFDVWPSVARIDEKLKFDDVMPDNYIEADRRVSILLRHVPKEYDLVFLDSRAGYDELIGATHANSDITINVEEDDLVSRITSDNLAAQLQLAAKTPIYRIVNKSMGRHSERIDDLGRIPFDADVMRSYGEEAFWTNITRSLLEPALVEIWNNLCRNEKLEFFIQSSRSSPIPLQSLEKSLSRISTLERLYLIYGTFFAIAGFILSFGGRETFYRFADDPFRLIGLVLGLSGVFMAFWAAIKSNRI